MFDFVPKLFWIYNKTQGSGIVSVTTLSIDGKTSPISISSLYTTSYIQGIGPCVVERKVYVYGKCSSDRKTYYWYTWGDGGFAGGQYNASKTIYYWIAIG